VSGDLAHEGGDLFATLPAHVLRLAGQQRVAAAAASRIIAKVESLWS
jgi:hypothetical protein